MGVSFAGPSLPRLPSSDSNEDREMDFDDHRDFMDQDVSAGQFPTADPGPIHQFLSGIPESRLVELQSRIPRPGFGKPFYSSEGTEPTWDIPSRRN
jgi:hypothetical protein